MGDMDHHIEDHDRGLAFDLATLGRRRVLALMGGVGLAALAGCGTDHSQHTAAASSTTSTTTTTAKSQAAAAAAADCGAETPQETGGPYPADGTNGPNVLTESGIVRSDIRSSFGNSTTTAKGVPLTVELTIVDFAKSCAAMPGAAVYLWHCDINGSYSMYAKELTNENYLRGVQEADAQGKVKFTSIFPAAYSGRWPHIHFEIYPSLAEATKAGDPLKTTQLALPKDICTTVYGTEGYTQSVRNLAQTSLERDNVFSDGYETQLAAVTGDVSNGYAATLTVRV
ncbi:protocatechuate 3,4-dioxygenase beta subunit [Actinokineospora baliensis]|uniref:intradiol ring-cleavage dioxygenase n=1 Tax=Actinokineospora baliensis TaxID=547056 RepID=UPI001EF84CA7|nr:intradiol ring-cleavage dioxygenase [Actinokineospora baliensis]MBM7771435.1 protocatechuate 3,4-dioxygenase beta subunit [Actinokineospora baliensis]